MDHSPRNIGELLDDALLIYRCNFRTVFPAAAALLFPFGLLQGVLQAYYTRAATTVGSGAAAAAGELLNERFVALIATEVGALVTLIPLALAAVWFQACMLSSAPYLEAGGRLSWREILKAGKRSFLPLLLVLVVTRILVQVAAYASFFVLGLAGLVLAALMYLAPAVTVVEGAQLDAAIRRSFVLGRANLKRLLLFVLAAGLLNAALTAAVMSPSVITQLFSAVRNPEAVFRAVSPFEIALQGLLQALATSLVAPLYPLFVYEVYVDTRARLEGMDIVERAQRAAA